MKIELAHSLSKFFSSETALKKKYGTLYPKIRAAISILASANCLQDVPNTPPTRRHKLIGDKKGDWAVDLNKSWRMIILPKNGEDNPSNIQEVIIVSIEDYH